MGDICRVNARRFRNKIACDDGIRKLRYSDLLEEVNRFANALLGFGLQRGDIFAISLGNKVEHVVALLAASKVGITTLPIDVKLKLEELQNIMDVFQPKGILYDSAIPVITEGLNGDFGALKNRAVFVNSNPEETATPPGYRYESLLSKASSIEPQTRAHPDDCFTIMLTSGTMGLPKGCIISHSKYVLRCLSAGIEGTGADESIGICAAPIYFNSGREGIVAHLFFGATVILRDRVDPEGILQLIQEARATYLKVAPKVAREIANVAASRKYDTSSLRCLRKAGAPFPLDVLEALRGHVTKYIFQSYASTETSVVSLLSPEQQASRYGSAGKPIWGVEVGIFDDQGRELPIGGVGEICCHGPLLFDGYYKNDEATRAAFRREWYTTGDTGYVGDDGYLWVTGRKKDMIKSGGISLAPGELETLLREYDGVKDVAVIGVPDMEWGEAVVSIVVADREKKVREESLISYCKTKLANYKAPKKVVFVEALPYTDLGKVDKNLLRARFRGLMRDSE